MSAARPWRVSTGGVRVHVRVTPRASRDAVEGVEPTADGPALKVRVRAVPDKGEANAAVTEAVARWLGVPKASVTLAAGGKSRLKALDIAGDAPELEARLLARLEAPDAKG